MVTPEVPSIRSLPRTLQADALTPAALEAVHDQTMTVLEKVGVGVGEEAMCEALAEAGADVDIPTKRVRFPASMVERALEQSPRTYTLAARIPDFDLLVDGQHSYLAVDGCAAEILDHESGERRASTKEDLAKAMRLADALPEIGILWQPMAARDVPRRSQSLHELHAQFTNSGKHVQMMTAVTPEVARGVVEIARVVAGGSDSLRKRPILSAFECSLSPLMYESGALEAAQVYAEAGVPCGFVVMPISCATGPATAAGTLVQSNAEVLAGITTLQALVPGAATFYGSCATVMDLRSGAAACGGPEDLYLQMASAQLARHYGVPSAIGTFATGSKSPDWQAGLENGLSGFASLLAGADLMCGAGLLFGARVYSLAEMVLDAEIFNLLHYMTDASAMSLSDSIAEVIESVGPGGHYLSDRHTLANMRRQWMPKLFDRLSWEDWESAGNPGPMDAATERVQSLLNTHEPPPLEDGVEEEILRIIEAFERGDGGKEDE
jgi:trimethylamine--corrinoid protein Co-methyltransferase